MSCWLILLFVLFSVTHYCCYLDRTTTIRLYFSPVCNIKWLFLNKTSENISFSRIYSVWGSLKLFLTIDYTLTVRSFSPSLFIFLNFFIYFFKFVFPSWLSLPLIGPQLTLFTVIIHTRLITEWRLFYWVKFSGKWTTFVVIRLEPLSSPWQRV